MEGGREGVAGRGGGGKGWGRWREEGRGWQGGVEGEGIG